ncbi:hotdog fold thioesterase [Eggerthellaceae bacterium zg-887]|uniref:PaaI family thioesterase n=1 Tax=Xiamenia xianingshaonis TaxID=2682776 RepID=UPI001409E514|nr:PaaI family thioesterase [Xiamenia xianingshaonis]NHM16796.1 hotdog fold thioesterase [Xiamenia xianingshaonis]
MALTDILHITFTREEKDRVEATMPVTPELHQPFGFLHGGATISLLESVGSRGAELWCDLDVERPFGVDVHVRHRKSVASGTVRGVATLDREEPSKTSGRKQFWNIAAYDELGDVVSEGVIVAKIVPLSRLAEKEAERQAARTKKQ